MPTNIFGILGTGASGLAASQVAMDITGDNIANANTDGYSRKRLVQSSSYRKDPNFGSMGFGVVSETVERYRDEFVDKRTSELSSESGYYSSLNDGMSRVEDVLLEPTDTGLNTHMNEFWNSWQDLANNPEDSAAREVVKQNADSLIGKFHSVVDKLRTYQNSLNDQIENAIEDVNIKTKDIFKLNKEIAEIEAKGQNANDSRDKRDRVMKELSSLVDVNYTEDKNGAYNVTMNGNLVVSLSDYFKVGAVSSLSERYDGTTKKSVGLEIESIHKPLDISSGSIKAYSDLRDNTIEDVLSSIDELANGIKTEVNLKHSAGYNLDGLTGINFFDDSSMGASDLELSSNIINDVSNIAAATGSTAVKATDTLTAPAAPDTYGTPIKLDTMTNSNFVNDTVVLKDNVAGNVLQEGTDYTVDYTRGTITLLSNSVVPAGRQLDVDFEYNVADYKGKGDGSNALDIASLREDNTMGKDIFGNNTKTFDETYNSFIGKVGSIRNDFKSSFESVDFISNQYKLQQDGIAGVSLDEEMINLVKFQHSYQASAKVISTVQRMLDTLINM